MTNFVKRQMFLPAEIGMRSLVGINPLTRTFPYGFGNYMSFAGVGNDDLTDKYRCVNFWAENLEEARRRFLLDGKVSVLYYEWNKTTGADPIRIRPVSQVLVNDPRIPADWYLTEFCFTGTYRPPLEVAIDMYSNVPGDHSDKLEEWTDPVAFHKKKGGTYDPKTGIIRYEVKSMPKPSITWTTLPMKEAE